ncbi:MAG: hypothetical protein A2486_08585 [Burkholderiales bacterium RIFOXYC12_FULL_65_23]|nr:MAG: hypothetical protein A2486_08585 [Burkholderiales bacterium RIFOXYC12_FULL_65_23]
MPSFAAACQQQGYARGWLGTIAATYQQENLMGAEQYRREAAAQAAAQLWLVCWAEQSSKDA